MECQHEKMTQQEFKHRTRNFKDQKLLYLFY